MEEGTNWSCGPCALANPGIETFVSAHQGNLIHITYHPNWPGGDDPMYLNDVTDNTNRVVAYYGISGVPDLVMDGEGSFNPGAGESAYFEAMWAGRIATLSPIALTITRTLNGSTVNVHVSVTAVVDVSAYSPVVLRVAAVENRVKGPGPNGEAYYINPMRTMMPSAAGTTLTLKPGVAQTFDFSYPVKAAYKVDSLYEVAFVQTDNTSHEVLQAASTKKVSLNLAPQAGTQIEGRVSAGTSNLGFTLTNNSTTDGQYIVKFSPNSLNPWAVTLSNQTTTGNPLTVSVPAGQSLNFSVQATEGASGYTSGLLTAVGSNDGGSSVLPIKMISPTTKLAFVDLYGDSMTAVQTELSLTNLTERYAKFSANEAATLATWSPAEYPEMIVGAGKWIVDGNVKTGLQNYLAAGGHALVHGGEIGFGLADPLSPTTNDKAYLSSVLHATYVKDSAGPRTIHGVQGDVVSGAASGTLNLYANSTTINEVNQPDQIKVTNGGIPIFYYGTSTAQIAGLLYFDTTTNQRLVYTAFGLENLSSTDEATIVESSLKWFRDKSWIPGTEGVASANMPTNFSLEQNFPNPFNPITEINYSLDQTGPVTMYLCDTKGAFVKELVNETLPAGQHTVQLDAHGLPSGTYFYVLRSGAQTLRRAMTLIR
jgi:hypothetical protein